jgi:hypothetical protein
VVAVSRRGGCAGAGIRHCALVMKRVITSVLLLAVWLGLATPAAAASLRISKPEVKKQVVEVIEAQLKAFRANDAPGAYGYSTAQLRAQTPLRAFVAIVQTNYPEIWSNTRAEFGLVRDDGTRATVLVHVFSKDGNAAFDYVLLRERGGWRVGSIVRHEACRKGSA